MNKRSRLTVKFETSETVTVHKDITDDNSPESYWEDFYKWYSGDANYSTTYRLVLDNDDVLLFQESSISNVRIDTVDVEFQPTIIE